LKALGIAGSLRKDSYNRKLLRIAERMVEELGLPVGEVDLKELNLPMYDGDVEAQGLPRPVRELKAAIEGADLLLIASPEYNYSVSGALKNAIDWATREKNSLDGKVAAIFGASTGIMGTVRGQAHLRDILEALNVVVVPQPGVFIRSARDAFDEEGSLKDPMSVQLLRELMARAVALTTKIRG
jgi:chromate reductase